MEEVRLRLDTSGILRGCVIKASRALDSSNLEVTYEHVRSMYTTFFQNPECHRQPAESSNSSTAFDAGCALAVEI